MSGQQQQQLQTTTFPNLRGKFSEQDLESFFRLYIHGRAALGSTRYLTPFTGLEDFIVDQRRSVGVLQGVDDLEIVNGQDIPSVLFRIWLCYVAPSCVYKHRDATYGQTAFYKCCFSDCGRPVSSQFALIRHYREQHYTRMPEGIFGELVIFKCDACQITYKRRTHLLQHFQSISHISRMAMFGKFFYCC